jgi:hypothetical protein
MDLIKRTSVVFFPIFTGWLWDGREDIAAPAMLACLLGVPDALRGLLGRFDQRDGMVAWQLCNGCCTRRGREGHGKARIF